MAKVVIGLGPLDEILGVPYYGNTLYQYVFFILITVLSVLLAKLFHTLVKKHIAKTTEKTGYKFWDHVTEVILAPMAYFLVLIGLFIGLQYLTIESALLVSVYSIFELLIALGVLWMILGTFERYLNFGLIPAQADKRFQTQMIPALSRFIKICALVVAFVILLGNLGFDVTALVAGLGIAGIAIGLAAKDVLSDVFGGISIFSKKLFITGDNITVVGLTGVVEDIDMRTTRIRAMDGKMISIPNAQVATNPVTINTRSKKSMGEGEEMVQVSMDLSIVYGTSAAKITKAIKIVKDSVNETKGCKKNPEVAFTDFKSSGLGISVIYDVEEPDNIMKVKHNVNLLIKKRFEEEGIKFAYPTSTVYLERGDSFA